MALASPFIGLDRLVLRLNGQPDAIELHHRWHIRDRFLVSLFSERLDLIDALIEAA